MHVSFASEKIHSNALTCMPIEDFHQRIIVLPLQQRVGPQRIVGRLFWSILWNEIAHSEEIVPTLGTHNSPDVAFIYCPFRHYNYVCMPFLSDKIILVTGASNTRHKNGITHKKMLELPILHSDLFRLSDVKWVLPSSHIYPLDINIISKMVPFLKEGDWYCAMPKHIVRDELAEGTLIEIPLLDVTLPEKQSYMVYRRSNYKRTDSIKKWVDDIIKANEEDGLN